MVDISLKRLGCLVIISSILMTPICAEPAEPVFQKTAQVINTAVLPQADHYFDLQGKKIFRWNDKTKYIMVHIADGSHLFGWRPEAPMLVKAALDEWESAMDHRFHFIYMPDGRGSDVTILWKAVADQAHNGDVAGVNNTVTYGKYIQSNDIEIVLNNSQNIPYSNAAIQSTALHEIGHMLGIKAHSNHPEDIMVAASSLQNLQEPRHLSRRDINTLRRIYQTKPSYTNPEGVHLSNFEQFKKAHPGGIRLLWVKAPSVPVPIPIPLPFPR